MSYFFEEGVLFGVVGEIYAEEDVVPDGELQMLGLVEARLLVGSGAVSADGFHFYFLFLELESVFTRGCLDSVDSCEGETFG